MKRENLRHFLFVGIACILSLPWFAPCTFGLGTIASSAINQAAGSRNASPLDHLPDPRLKQWAAKPGPWLEVITKKSIPHTLLITDAALTPDHPQALKAPRPGSRGKGAANDIIAFISTLAAISDAVTYGFLSSSSDFQPSEPPNAIEDQRRQLVLCESPFVLLQGAEVVFMRQARGKWPALALATRQNKVTMITPDGTFFALANRIHFRASSPEVILEGNPTVQSGQQHIKSAKPDTIMRLDFAKRRVTVNGPVMEKKLFR